MDSGKGRVFAAGHRWDRNFHLLMIALAWVGIVMGFGGSIAHHISQHRPPYPVIVHFHAVVFMSWLVLFTVQIFLIRCHKLAVHRRLGMAMAGIAAVMIVLGPATALTVQHARMNDPHADPAFLSIQLTDLLAFAGLITAGMLLRRLPSAHKRLMLLGTLYITDAGFARWLADGVIHLLGEGPVAFWTALYLAPNILFLLVCAYDLVTRRRLHPACLFGIIWILANQITAVFLYGTPAWTTCAKKIIALWPW